MASKAGMGGTACRHLRSLIPQWVSSCGAFPEDSAFLPVRRQRRRCSGTYPSWTATFEPIPPHISGNNGTFIFLQTRCFISCWSARDPRLDVLASNGVRWSASSSSSHGGRRMAPFSDFSIPNADHLYSLTTIETLPWGTMMSKSP